MSSKAALSVRPRSEEAIEQRTNRIAAHAF